MPWALKGVLWSLGHGLDPYLGWGGQETLSGHTDKVTAAKFKLTRHQAVTGSRDRTVKEWDLGRAYCEAQSLPPPPYLLAPPSQVKNTSACSLGMALRFTGIWGETSRGLSFSTPHWCFLPGVLVTSGFGLGSRGPGF